ncbi:hypothetical protein FEZ08_01565 [Culicoidibacter larvae]|uniref:Uncharacterized protein n=2 Tax=Culicoidibacter larvae TaxID=2579976 RepID=A0A5R8QIQ5_9FIRM|nr:hypothetical protein FEZ08_01565 [Culicoidibacter larvae]
MKGAIGFQKSNGKQYFTKLEDIDTFVVTDNHDIWVAPATFKTWEMSKRKTLHSRAIFLDFDRVDLEEINYRISAAALPPPNIIIWSGSASSFHVYWLLEEPTANVSLFLEPLAELLGADKQAINKNRVMRLPGTMNQESGTKASIISVIDTYYETEAFYNQLNEVLSTGYVPKYVPRPPEMRRPNIDKLTLDELFDIVSTCIIPEGERNYAVGFMTQYFEKQGKDYPYVLDFMRQVNRNNFRPKLRDAELIRMIKGWLYRYEQLNTLHPGYLQLHVPTAASEHEYVQIKTKKFSYKLPAKIIREHGKELTGNDIYILLLIRKYGLIDTAQLVFEAQVSRATVFNVLKRLKRLKIITEEPDGIRIREHHRTLQYISIDTLAIKLFEGKVIAPKAFKLMAVLKMHDGLENVKQKQLMKACGLTSIRKLSETLALLEANDLVYREKVGRRTVYNLNY